MSKKILRSAYLLIVLLCILFTGYTQPRDTLVIKNGTINLVNYRAKHQKLQLRKDISYYTDRKINLDKINEFKKAGVDLQALDKKWGRAFTYKETVLLADVIVEGKVIAKRFNTQKDVVFHSEYDVRVTKALKGGPPAGSVVTIKCRSGMVEGGQYLDQVGEIRLQVGENVLLYLNPVPVHVFEKAKQNGENFGTLNATAAHFEIKDKFILKDAYVFDTDSKKVGKQATVEADILTIHSINQ
jgi:hypothetical protein